MIQLQDADGANVGCERVQSAAARIRLSTRQANSGHPYKALLKLMYPIGFQSDPSQDTLIRVS